MEAEGWTPEGLAEWNRRCEEAQALERAMKEQERRSAAMVEAMRQHYASRSRLN